MRAVKTVERSSFYRGTSTFKHMFCTFSTSIHEKKREQSPSLQISGSKWILYLKIFSRQFRNQIFWGIFHCYESYLLWVRCYAKHVHNHGDVIKWKYFPRYWLFMRGIHRSPVNSPHKGQWRGALMFSLICAWINDWWFETPSRPLLRHCDILLINHHLVRNLSKSYMNTRFALWLNNIICQ